MVLLQNISLLILRFAFGYRLVHGSIDNIISWDRLLEFETFLIQSNFPFPLLSAVLSVYLQFLCGISWILGAGTKISGPIMMFNFLIAIFGVHVVQGDSYFETAPAIHMFCVAFLMMTIGPGNLTITTLFRKNSAF